LFFWLVDLVSAVVVLFGHVAGDAEESGSSALVLGDLFASLTLLLTLLRMKLKIRQRHNSPHVLSIVIITSSRHIPAPFF